NDCDSMCSMLLTLVVSERSKIETIRVSISEGTRPVYVQMTLITGMLMLGKISTGVRSRTTGLISSSTKENTMNVLRTRESKFYNPHKQSSLANSRPDPMAAG